MKMLKMRHICMVPIILASLILSACGASTDNENYGGQTLSEVRRGAAAWVEFDITSEDNPAIAVYKYAVADEQEIIATLTVPGDKDYDLYLYNTDGARVAKVETSGNGVDESLEFTIDNFTTLYVVIYDGIGNSDTTNTGGNYGLILSLKAEEETPDLEVPDVEIVLTETPETAGDNESAANAQEITTNTVVTGSLAYGTDYDDFYILDVVAGDTLTISLIGDNPSPTVNFNLQLFTVDSSFIQQSENSTSTEQTVYTIPEGMDQLVVLVVAYNGAGTYELTVKSSLPAGDSCGDGVLTPITETTDAHASWETAQVVSLNSVTCANLSVSLNEVSGIGYFHESEKDIYIFDVTEGDNISVSLTGLDVNYLQYHIFNGDDGSHISNDYEGADLDGSIAYTVAPGVSKILVQVIYTKRLDAEVAPEVTTMPYKLTITTSAE